MEAKMVNSKELLDLANSIRSNAMWLKAQQYKNGSYSRTGGDCARMDMSRMADKLTDMAQRMMYVEARLAAMTTVYPEAIILIKGDIA